MTGRLTGNSVPLVKAVALAFAPLTSLPAVTPLFVAGMGSHHALAAMAVIVSRELVVSACSSLYLFLADLELLKPTAC